MGQPGFFDLSQRHKGLDENKEPIGFVAARGGRFCEKAAEHVVDEVIAKLQTLLDSPPPRNNKENVVHISYGSIIGVASIIPPRFY